MNKSAFSELPHRELATDPRGSERLVAPRHREHPAAFMTGASVAGPSISAHFLQPPSRRDVLRGFGGTALGLALREDFLRESEPSPSALAIPPPPKWGARAYLDPNVPPPAPFGKRVANYGGIDGLNAGMTPFVNHLSAGGWPAFSWSPGQDLILAFGCCSNGFTSAWDAVSNESPTPNAMFCLGDLVYPDGGNKDYMTDIGAANKICWQQFPEYEQRTYNYLKFFGVVRNHPTLQKIAKKMFVYGMQDDHDYGADGIEGGAMVQMVTQNEPDAWFPARQVEFRTRIRETNLAFRHFFPQPGGLDVTQPTYHSFDIPGADVRVICLDNRHYTDSHLIDPAGALSYPGFLGKDQFDWFLRQYDDAKGLVVIMSPMSPSVSVGLGGSNQINAKSFDLWTTTLNTKRSGPTIVACGDRHACTISQISPVLGPAANKFECSIGPMGSGSRHTIGNPRFPVTRLWSNSSQKTPPPFYNVFGVLTIKATGGVTLKTVQKPCTGWTSGKGTPLPMDIGHGLQDVLQLV